MQTHANTADDVAAMMLTQEVAFSLALPSCHRCSGTFRSMVDVDVIKSEPGVSPRREYLVHAPGKCQVSH